MPGAGLAAFADGIINARRYLKEYFRGGRRGGDRGRETGTLATKIKPRLQRAGGYATVDDDGDSRSATQFTFKGNAKNVRSFD